LRSEAEQPRQQASVIASSFRNFANHGTIDWFVKARKPICSQLRPFHLAAARWATIAT